MANLRRVALLFFLCVLLTFSAYGQVMLTVTDVNSEPGSTVMVPIVISEAQGITAIQFEISFETSVLSVSDENPVRSGEALSDHSVSFNEDSGVLRVVVFSGSLSPLKESGGAIVQVMFEVADGVSSGLNSSITLSGIQASDEQGNAVPVIGVNGTLTTDGQVRIPAPGENELIFPQIANGSYSGGSYRITLVFVNKTKANTSGEIELYKSDGSPLTVTLTDGRTDSSFSFTVSPGGSIFLETDGTGDLSTGYARLSATSPLGGTLLFATRNPSGAATTEAGVGASPSRSRFSIPVLYDSKNRTGIAFANISAENANVDLLLKDKSGSKLAETNLTLTAGEHRPRFASELFDDLTEMSDFQGVIEVSSSVKISAVALKLQGSLLTTFPVIGLD
jgi:hypothetical protein